MDPPPAIRGPRSAIRDPRPVSRAPCAVSARALIRGGVGKLARWRAGMRGYVVGNRNR